MEKEIPYTNQYSLYENLSKVDTCECMIILDFFHYEGNNGEEFIKKHLMTIKEFCFQDLKISYLIFCKPYVMEDSLGVTNSNLKKFVVEVLEQNGNIFMENKLTNIHFLSGFILGKEKTIYIYTDQNCNNSQWLKIKDQKFCDKIKFSEFEYLKVTLDYLSRGKRKYEQKAKQPSKLKKLLEGETVNQPSNNKESVVVNISDNEIVNLHKFQQIVEQIIQYFSKSPPKNFKIIKNIITNFAEQNSPYFFKNYNIREDVLAFYLLRELLNREVIVNVILSKLIREKMIMSLEEIETLLSFYINPSADVEMAEENSIEDIFDDKLKTTTKTKTKRKKKDSSSITFSISQDAEDQYSKLILNCLPVCNYVKKIIIKVLSNFGLTTIEKLPTNPGKYKNYIFSHVNNQELMKISNKILNLDYEKIVNIITEGIIIEFMRNNLVLFITDKKIHYNIAEIEREKFRLAQMQNL